MTGQLVNFCEGDAASVADARDLHRVGTGKKRSAINGVEGHGGNAKAPT